MPPAGTPRAFLLAGDRGDREPGKDPGAPDEATDNPKTTEKGMEKPQKRKKRPNFDELS